MTSSEFGEKLLEVAKQMQMSGRLLAAANYLEESADDYMARTSLPPLYSHRNGESEPPTVEGWYFLKQHGNARWAANPAHPLVSVIVMNHELTVWTWDKETPVKDIKGRWWGPVALPWEQA